MAKPRLISEEMINTSRPWINAENPAYAIIAACPETAALSPRIKAVHDELVKASQPASDDVRLAEISEKQARLDLRHDDLIRGESLVLTGMAYLLGMATPEGTELIDLRDAVQPDGLESVNKTYRAEAGQAEQLAERLPGLKAGLDAIVISPAGKKTLVDFVEERIKLGHELGELEDEKARIAAAPTEESDSAAHVRARNQWINLANALEANARLGGMSDADMAVVFGPLWAAEKAADRRGRGSAGGGGATPPQGGGGTPPPAGGGTPPGGGAP